LYIPENTYSMQSIDNEIKSALSEIESTMAAKASVLRLENANARFESLVKRGLAHKRGYTLFGIHGMNAERAK
jgi:hypothetical protein